MYKKYYWKVYYPDPLEIINTEIAPLIKERKRVEVQSLLDESYAAPGPVQQEAE